GAAARRLAIEEAGAARTEPTVARALSAAAAVPDRRDRRVLPSVPPGRRDAGIRGRRARGAARVAATADRARVGQGRPPRRVGRWAREDRQRSAASATAIARGYRCQITDPHVLEQLVVRRRTGDEARRAEAERYENRPRDSGKGMP